MEQKKQKYKIIMKLIMVLTLFAVMGNYSTAFPHGLVEDNLKPSFWFPDSKGLTIAGEQRQCTELPVESHTIYFPTKGFTLQMQCEEEPALINLYYVNEKEVWDFDKGDEFESPAVFKTTEAGMWAWECYSCLAEQECKGNLGYACKTMTSKQSCVNEKFYGQPIECAKGEYCDNGKCVNPLEMEPSWKCHDWGDCKADKKGQLYQTRICYDARATGSTANMPESIQSCDKEEYLEDSAKNEESENEEPDVISVPGGTVTPSDETAEGNDSSFKWGWLIALAGIGFFVGLFMCGGDIALAFIIGICGALIGLIINLLMWMA